MTEIDHYDLTEMAGVAEAETQAAYAWALDYDDPDEFPTQPTQRLTSRRIMALGIAASLVLIALAGAVALIVPQIKSSEPVVAAAPAGVLDGTYRLDYDWAQSTVMGSPNSPSEVQSMPQTYWTAYRSTCTPAGCTATSMGLDDKTHTVASTPSITRQWRFTNGQWVTSPDRERAAVDGCINDEGKVVAGDETISHTKWLDPQPDGTLRGVSSVTTVSGECGREGGVHHTPFIATRVGDVPSGVAVADPSTVSAPDVPVAPVAGPVLDGIYRFDSDDRQTTYSDGSRVPPTAGEHSHWVAFRSICTVTGCVATVAQLDDANHQEPTGLANVFRFTNGHWVDNGRTGRIPCGQFRRAGTATDEQTVTVAIDLVPQPDGTLRGVDVITFKTNECGTQYVMTTPVVVTRTGPVPPNVVLADPALFT